jgi:pyridoxal phosphate-dependent aminotransferase EpsN
VLDSSEQRDRVLAALAADDIEARPLWKPMHAQPVYAAHEAHVTGVSDDLFARGLCLPSGSVLTQDDVLRVVDVVRQAMHS